MSKDVILAPTNKVAGAITPNKPIYLILIDDGKSKKKFLTIDRPDLQASYVQAKGIFSDISEENISDKYQDILTSVPKESILEMIFPWNKILSIKNLIFNKVK